LENGEHAGLNERNETLENDDDDEDDESEVDLTEALARMTEDVDDDDDEPSKITQHPKTEHEIDLTAHLWKNFNPISNSI
jgi:hypothetical protein